MGERSFSVKSHETFAPEYWGEMVKEAAYPFAVIKESGFAAKVVPDKLMRGKIYASLAGGG